MGVQKIPLRLPRAAPVPLCSGSSSSISPCLPPVSPADPSTTCGDRASLLRLRNQTQKKKSESALNPSLGATLQHRLNHPIAVKQKLFLGEGRERTTRDRPCDSYLLVNSAVRIEIFSFLKAANN